MFRMIDAHVHFWKYNKIKDAWITDEMKILQQRFSSTRFTTSF